jgi:hypothetical protein
MRPATCVERGRQLQVPVTEFTATDTTVADFSASA